MPDPDDPDTLQTLQLAGFAVPGNLLFSAPMVALSVIGLGPVCRGRRRPQTAVPVDG